jgi:hypothetical protein
LKNSHALPVCLSDEEQILDEDELWSIGRLILTGENKVTPRKICNSATLSITHLTRSGLESNPRISFSVTKTKRLVLFREINTTEVRNIQNTDTLCVQE